MADPSKQAFLNTLFQWTVKNTSGDGVSESETQNSEAQVMDPERKTWLNEALENITINPIERIKLCISKLKDDQVSDEQKQEFLEELGHWAEELDLAKDFFTVGGIEILAPLLDSSNTALCSKTCSLIANLVQNNDHCQRIIVQSSLQEKLIKLVDESNDPEVKTKAVTAISALTRGYTLGQLQLQKYQGIKVLIRALSSPIPRLQNKLCFLINILCGSSSQMKKLFYENDALQALIRLANDPSCPDYVQVLRTIMTIAGTKSDRLVTLAEKEPELIEQFEFILSKKREEILHSAEYHEDVTLMNEVRTILRRTSESDTSYPSTPTSPIASPLMLTHTTS